MDSFKLKVEKREDADAEGPAMQCQSCDAAGSPPSLTAKQPPDAADEETLSPLGD